ncbi:MAG: acyl-CoA thioesterase [Fimbriiglobus sp.]|jgi:YbgC/YbaW family acyl-CoA thioester hydrolase|nr:acyl-CoA thioesterase [Fimbriiglobus sp.]
MFTLTRRVEFSDTDMAGIMHFSNFFRFMEAAETAFLNARGLSVTWQADGVRYGFPRVNASCDYVRPVRFEDVLTIGVSVEKVGTKSVAYRFEFTHAGEPIATGRMTAVYCKATPPHGIEALPIPAELRTKLEATE